MNILFSIDYNTAFGEELVLNLINSDTEPKTTAQYRMHTVDGHTWACDLKLKKSMGTSLDYYYSVENGDSVIRREWEVQGHRLEINSIEASVYKVYDRWIEMPEDSYLYSSAYTHCINRHHQMERKTCVYRATLRFKVRAPQLTTGDSLWLVGDQDVMGAWDASKALPMYEHTCNEWVADIDATKLTSQSVDVKFVIKHKDEEPMWELGYDRHVELVGVAAGEVLIYELPQAAFPIEDTRSAGTLVPVFSLRSRDSFGVGDFGDLRKMIDWVAKTGQRLLQILPINDTTTTHTWTDSYPYNSISIFALHPQYADLTALPQIEDKEKREHFEKLRQELNALPQIDYERVNEAKTEYLRVLFTQEGKSMMAGPAFKKFFEEEKLWLVPYAQYSHLRDLYGTADFTCWPDHKSFNEDDRKALSNPRTKAYKEVAFFYFVQYILYVQMSSAHEYARSKGVILKGDIPIGVNRYGCDVWQDARYFNLNGQAGAPPDDFSANGQNWGFPTYNWDLMVEEDCAWWMRRFSNMAKYFDAYRIDHVLGFFRIWEIPIHSVHGLLGQFSPALGMTREEIEAYGLQFQEEFFTVPFITDWVLERIFGEHAQLVRDNFLEPTSGGRYRMKPEFDTQRKVEEYFRSVGVQECRGSEAQASPSDVGNSSTHQLVLSPAIKEGLYSLISNVLFVRDIKDDNKFHPRIAVQNDFIYETLYDCDKHAFNRLYNDYFYRRNNQFWYREAMKKLPKLVQATSMLVCAEDLGMVPDCVEWVMRELRILSLELQSMPKDPTVRFGILERNPYRSVCTISSHDMPTLRQWWDEDYERTQTYYNMMLMRNGEAPHPLPAWLAREIISRQLACPSMLCVLAIQDWLAIDEKLRLPDANAERINIPANPRHYWRYRMHVCIEDLMENAEYNNNITDLIKQNRRT